MGTCSTAALQENRRTKLQQPDKCHQHHCAAKTRELCLLATLVQDWPWEPEHRGGTVGRTVKPFSVCGRVNSVYEDNNTFSPVGDAAREVVFWGQSHCIHRGRTCPQSLLSSAENTEGVLAQHGWGAHCTLQREWQRERYVFVGLCLVVPTGKTHR